MAEKRVARLIPYAVQYVCDKCGKAYMHSTGIVYPTYPPQMEHVCADASCGFKKNFVDTTYPKVEYVREEIQEETK